MTVINKFVSQKSNRGSQGLSGFGLFSAGELLLVRRKQLLVDVGHHRSLRDDAVAHQLVEFVVASDREIDVLRRDGLLFSELRVGTSKLQNFTDDVLEDGSHETSSGGRCAI